MIGAAKRKSLSPVSVDGSAVPGGSAPAGLPCGSLSRRLPHASAAAVRVLLLLVVTLCLGQTRVWGFGITAPPASGVFESVTPSSTGENTIGSGYDASDSPLAARAGENATGVLGRSGEPLVNAAIQPIRNQATTISGRQFTGHALDQMQNRGFMPSVVENTIKQGTTFPTRAGTTGFYDSVNNVRVITDSASGRVVTVIPGAP